MTSPVIQLPEFKELIQKRKALTIPLLIVTLVGYFGFILAIAYVPDLMGQKIGTGVTTLGIALGLGVIFLTFVVTGIFVHRSNQSLETLVDAIHKKVGG